MQLQTVTIQRTAHKSSVNIFSLQKINISALYLQLQLLHFIMQRQFFLLSPLRKFCCLPAESRRKAIVRVSLEHLSIILSARVCWRPLQGLTTCMKQSTWSWSLPLHTSSICHPVRTACSKHPAHHSSLIHHLRSTASCIKLSCYYANIPGSYKTAPFFHSLWYPMT